MKTTFNEVVRKYEQKQRRKKLTAILIVGLVMVNMLVLDANALKNKSTIDKEA